MSGNLLLANLVSQGEASSCPQRHSNYIFEDDAMCEEASKLMMWPSWPDLRPPKAPPYDFLPNLLSSSCIAPHHDPELELFRRLVSGGEASCLASHEVGLQGNAFMPLQQQLVANQSTHLGPNKPIPKRGRECGPPNEAKEPNTENFDSSKRQKSLPIKKEEPTASAEDDKGRINTPSGGQARPKSSGIKAKTPTKPAEAHTKSPTKPAEARIKAPAKSAEDPKTDFIHVRARRGQATDSHSLAERVRREKISQRMRFLQDLVPGCSKITGKAMMLDEIINYVQSLQHQVEFLAMKLAAVSPKLDLNFDNFMGEEFATTLGEVNGACHDMVTNSVETQSPSYHIQLQNLCPFDNLRPCDEDLSFISDVSTTSLI